MKEIYHVHTTSKSKASSIIKGENYRFTILTDHLIRIEYQAEGQFVDLPSQVVWNRNFNETRYEILEEDSNIIVRTRDLQMEYKKGEIFSKDSLVFKAITENNVVIASWHFGDEIQTLKGTIRTLDGVDGSTQLGEGMISRQGLSLIDDSKSYLILENGELQKRPDLHNDYYIFGYGHSYQDCIKDFYQLTSMPPLLPRYALGNWWSRFHRYDVNEYKELITTFQEKKIPLSIAVIDMDWHITEVGYEYGGGWTGYTWNKNLFPDPEDFLHWLHDKKLRVTLNVHPAQGVRPYEEAYESMAESLGYDSTKKETVVFDAADTRFIESYFEHLHHPMEKEGVDFWWIDWQQGEDTKIPGLDPLWILNHYHYLDNSKNKIRPMVLSRYAGLGSHRYPVGFSGDSIISWESLDFQPYFTATASNVGYCWWSHDIGGHMMGIYNEELQIRWIQFGVFSPIMRLHSSASVFNHKEPWNYSLETETIISQYLKLRHSLIPYLYTMNQRAHISGIPLVRPMYYEYPEEIMAYHCPNEYFFGSEFIVLPVTSKVNEDVKVSKVNFWFPEEIYIDFFTGLVYQGKHKMNLYRSKNRIPVLMKAGAIVPLALEGEEINDTSNPERMEICIAAGANGEFSLYEDDGVSLEYENGHYVVTKLILDYEKESEFIIEPPQGDIDLIPNNRIYQLRMKGFNKPEKIHLITKSETSELDYEYDCMKNEILIKDIKTDNERVQIRFIGGMTLARNATKELCFDILDQAEIDFMTKEIIFDLLHRESIEGILSAMQTLSIDSDLYGAISEVLLAQDIKS